MIYCTNKLKKKNKVILPIDANKAFDKELIHLNIKKKIQLEMGSGLE